MPLLLGGIVMWSGLVEEIPAGWALCDGQNDTLDLRNKFIVGAGDLYAVGVTGGFADAQLVSHNHTLTITSGNNHGHSLTAGNTFPNPWAKNVYRYGRAQEAQSVSAGTTTTGNHSHTINVNNSGSSATNANLPPYYALAFIQQVE